MAPSLTATSTTSGFQSGDGYLTITYASSNGSISSVLPSVIPANHPNNINLSLALVTGSLDTGWSGSTTFTVSGVAGVNEVSSNVSSSTAATVVVNTASSTGSLLIFDGFSTSSPITVATASLSSSPTSTPPFKTTTVTLTGTNTVWTQEATSSLFSISGVSGVTIGSVVVNSDTSATASITASSSTGNLTLTDNSTGVTQTLVVPAETLTVAPTSISAATTTTVTLTGGNTAWT